MRRLALLAVLALLPLTVAFAQREDQEGKEWLNSCSEPAAINVTGIWASPDWGRMSLSQHKDSRKVIGSGDGWDISGVVSGNSVCLLYSHNGKVAYSARLTADEGTSQLSGAYTRGLLSSGSRTKTVRFVK